MDISCKSYDDPHYNNINFWANQAKNDYAKWGTAELFRDYGSEDMLHYISNNESLRSTLYDHLDSFELRALKQKYMNFTGVQLTEKEPEVKELTSLTKELLELI